MNSFLYELKKDILVFDGSKGTMMQKMGLSSDECPEIWNLTQPKQIKELYKSYVNAGSDVIQTNTFGANRAILQKFNLENKIDDINTISVKLAKEAAENNAFIAASIGPSGKLLEPSGELTLEDAYNIYKEQVILVTQAGADIINFETISDLAEMRVAILAARENSPLPIIASMTFEPNGYTLMGNSPATCALVCQSLGADCIGANCSTGPDALLEIIKQMHSISHLPLCAKANAGLPEYSGNTITYSETPETFKRCVNDYIHHGVRLIGGCCGTTPEFIKSIKNELSKVTTPKLSLQTKPGPGSFICSSSKYVDTESIDKTEIVHFINKSNINNFRNNNAEDFLDKFTDRSSELNSGISKAVYLNLDTTGKPELLPSVTKVFQTYCRLPLIIQSDYPPYLEAALRLYNGKAGVVIGDMSDHTFDLIISAKKYGSTVIDKSHIF